jgi:tRNA(adenine34) deaminase
MYDTEFMMAAIAQAKKAEAADEVPVGAVIEYGGKIIAAAHNTRETDQNPIAHAEMSAIQQAAQAIGSWRLIGCTLYVTLEPCPMCAGAIINSRIPRVVFGAYDKKAGAFGTLYDLSEGKLNHKPEIIGGMLEEECSEILSGFFRSKRRR